MNKRYTLALMVMAILIGVISISLVSADTSATIDYEGLAEGTTVSSLSCGTGITCPGGDISGSVSVNAFNPRLRRVPAGTPPNSNTAMIFDAECVGGCSGSDIDLLFPGHGKTMINSEDLDNSDPDDQVNIGSFMEFDFTSFGPGQVTVVSIDVGDIEEREDGAFVESHVGNCEGHPLPEGNAIPLPITGNNKILTTNVNFSGVECLHVHLNGSGTVDNIKLSIPDQLTPGIDIEKATNGKDADLPNGNDVPQIAAGQTVTWTYVVTNTGDVALADVFVDDDGGTPGDPSDDFRAFLSNPSNPGDIAPKNGMLDVGETWEYTAFANALDLSSTTSTDLACGTENRPFYGNMGKVTGTPVGSVNPVTAVDPSHYCNPPEEGKIDIEKWTKIVAAPTGGGDVCKTLGKPKLLRMLYTGNNILEHSQRSGKVNVNNFNGDSLPNGQVHIISAEKSNGTGKTYFDDTVDIGDEFDIDGTAGMRSQTFVLIFDQSDKLLRTIEFHTSCSQPLELGNQFGGIQLISFTGKDGKSGSFNPPTDAGSGFGEDADIITGPPGLVGDVVVWTYFVTNTGDVPLTDILVGDDDIGVTPTYVSGDDGDNVLAPNKTETWIYQARGKVQLGQYKNIGDVSGLDPIGTKVTDRDPSHHIGVAPAGDICDTLGGKPKTLTMRYTGGSDQDHSQGDKVTVTGDPGSASPVHIIAAKNSDGGGSRFFDGNVSLEDLEDQFVINGSQSKLGSSTYVLIYDLDGNLLQTILFHTSCSKPLERGNQFGGIQLVDISS